MKLKTKGLAGVSDSRSSEQDTVRRQPTLQKGPKPGRPRRPGNVYRLKKAATILTAAVIALVQALAAPSTANAIEGSDITFAPAGVSWMGKLDIKNPVRLLPDGSSICGATLVNSDWALTAQHCVHNVNAKNIRVTFNSKYLNGRGGWTTGVTEIQAHPNYDGDLLFRDVALLKLKDSSPSYLSPVRLATSKADQGAVRANASAVIMGWGSWAENSSRSGALILGKMRINFVSLMRIHALPATRSGASGGSGDSGGPILISTGSGMVQVGVFSGSKTGEQEPGLDVYNRIDPRSTNWAWFSSITGIEAE